MEAGTIYRERAKPGPFESESEWRITQFDPPSRQVRVDRIPEMEAELRIGLEPEGEGTRWHHEMDCCIVPKIRPLGWLLEKLVVRRKMQSDFRRILGSGKELIGRESRAAASGSGAGEQAHLVHFRTTPVAG